MTEPIPIHITFSIEPGKEGDRMARFKFWDSPSTVQWFKRRGYTLYQRVKDSAVLRPTYPSEADCNNAEYPYAFFDSDKSNPSAQPLQVYERWGKVAYAQDSLNRHVVIKIVPAETDEYRVLRFLKEQNLETLKDNCVMPVLDLLPIEGYYFAVMPRWGYSIDVPYMQNIQQVIILIHSLLKGLAYLHEHNIVHGDISHQNFLASHFSGGLLFQNQTRRDLRASHRLLYAIIDFDFAIMLSPETRRRGLRRHYHELCGTRSAIKDTHSGECDFDPFIFDVGVIGALLCADFQHLSQQLPLLAPLLDRMTTWDLNRRFTASEALQFFEEGISEVADDHLKIHVHENHRIVPYDEYDRWDGLPHDFVETWNAYRTPPLPWSLWFLRRLHRLPSFPYIIPATRSCCYTIAVLPQRIVANIWSSKIIF